MCLAVPGKIIAITGTAPMERVASVDFGGLIKDVSLCYVPDAGIGDYVIVHVGFAISRLDEAAAAQALEFIAQLDAGEA